MKASNAKRQTLAKNLKYLISNNAGTAHNQKDLADALGVTQTAVSYWLSGKKFPRNETLENIAGYFGVSVSDLTDFDIELKTKSNKLDFDSPVTQSAVEHYYERIQHAKTDSERAEIQSEWRGVVDELYLSNYNLREFIDSYKSLNEDGQEKVKSYAADLAENPKYRVDGDE